MIKQIFLLVQSTLCREIPGLHIDRDNAQPERIEMGQDMIWPRPAAFIRIGISWEQMGRGTRTGTASITIRLVQDNTHDSYAGSSQQEKALEVYDLIERVDTAIDGISGDCMKPLFGTGITPDGRFNRLIVDELTYTAGIIYTATDRARFETTMEGPVDLETEKIEYSQPSGTIEIR